MNTSDLHGHQHGVRRERLVLVALLITALVARAAFLAWQPDLGFGDLREYVSGARRVLAGEPLAVRNWMHFVRAPGYSLFIAGVWLFTGESMLALKVAQVLLSVATCGVAYGLTRDVFGPRPAVLAAAFLALHPFLIQLSATPSSETLFAFLVLTGTWFLTKGLAADRPDLRWVTAGAIVLTLGNLVRPNWSVVLPLLAGWIIWRYLRRRPVEIVRIGLALAIPYFTITLVWVSSIWSQGLGFVWVSDGGAVFYYMGHNDLSHEFYCSNPSDERRQYLLNFPAFVDKHPAMQRIAKLPQQERISAIWDTAFDWDRNNLDKLPCMTAGKFADYWSPWVHPRVHGLVRALLSLAVTAPLFALGFAGMYLSRRRAQRTLRVLLVHQLIAGTFVAVAFSTAIRYRIPLIDVLLIPFAAFATSVLLQRLRHAKSAPEAQDYRRPETS